MKKIIFILLAAIALASCSNNGKKIKVEGTKGEIYYKGDGVTEDDAKKIGEFLKNESYFNSDKGSTVQITKEGEEYTMRFVYNKSIYDSMKGADDAFKLLAAKASKEVFGGKKVNIALANKTMKDFKTIPYDEATAKAMEAPQPSAENAILTKSDFDHEAKDGVDFYWKGISDDESKTIVDYIVKDGSFAGGTAELYMTKEADRIIIRFPMIESARNDPSYISELSKVSKQIKDNVFANVPFSFFMTDEKFNTVKAWDY